MSERETTGVSILWLLCVLLWRRSACSAPLSASGLVLCGRQCTSDNKKYNPWKICIVCYVDDMCTRVCIYSQASGFVLFSLQWFLC